MDGFISVVAETGEQILPLSRNYLEIFPLREQRLQENPSVDLLAYLESLCPVHVYWDVYLIMFNGLTFKSVSTGL